MAIPRQENLRYGVFALLLPLCVFCSMASAPVASVPTPETLQQRLGAVSTLIETSSGAKQVESSGIPAAVSRRIAARVLHRAAEAAFRDGDNAGALTLLGEASRVMFEAVRVAAPEQVNADKQRRDFEARLESTKALLEAQKRIGKEKGLLKSDEFVREAEELLTRANSMAARGEIAQARITLDQSYLAIKAAVRGMRSGETLVRSLNFANKAEEYHYEIDRNDTHLLLVNVLLAEKRGSNTVDAMVLRALEEAARLRKSAELSADKRDFENGVRELEDSTRELVRAIRGAGVYIPG